MWVKKGNPKKSRSKRKWGCQIGENGGRLKYFLQKMLHKKKVRVKKWVKKMEKKKLGVKKMWVKKRKLKEKWR